MFWYFIKATSAGCSLSTPFALSLIHIYSLLITLIRQLILIVPLGFLLSCFLGPAGIWICFPVSEAVAALAAVWIVKRKQILDF